MNKTFLTGRLTADPELTETSAGVSLCRFSIAVQRDYKTNNEIKTDFFDIVAWRELAETVARYRKKGDKVLVEGSMTPRQYEDSKGTNHKTVDITAQKVEFLTPRVQLIESNESDRGFTGGSSSPRPAQQLQVFDDDSDIPF